MENRNFPQHATLNNDCMDLFKKCLPHPKLLQFDQLKTGILTLLRVINV